MFTYFRHPLIKTEAVELLSVEAALEDEERKKILIENAHYDIR